MGNDKALRPSNAQYHSELRYHWQRFIGFKRMPDSIQVLVLKTIKACGIRRVWILDAAHDKIFSFVPRAWPKKRH